MHCRGAVMCRPKDIGTPRQEYWRKKWGNGRNGSGPQGWKAKPFRIFMINMRKANEMSRGKKAK